MRSASFNSLHAGEYVQVSSSADFQKYNFSQNLFQGHMQNVKEYMWIQIGFYCLISLICVQTVSKSYQQITLSDKYSKTGLKRPFKRPKLVFKIDYRLMQVKSIAGCSKRGFTVVKWVQEFLKVCFLLVFLLLDCLTLCML